PEQPGVAASDAPTRSGDHCDAPVETQIAHGVRSSRLRTLPDGLRGNASMNVTSLGTLNFASWPRQCSISSAAVASAPGASTTTATGTSPHRSSGRPITATSTTAGCSYSTRSTSELAMFSPPDTIMSFSRSTMYTYPSPSLIPMSPVWNQPPRNAAAVASGSFQYPGKTFGPRSTTSPRSPAGTGTSSSPQISSSR